MPPVPGGTAIGTLNEAAPWGETLNFPGSTIICAIALDSIATENMTTMAGVTGRKNNFGTRKLDARFKMVLPAPDVVRPETLHLNNL